MKQIIDRQWVVYLMSIYGKHITHHSVCTQAEWAELEKVQPGKHKLVRDGFTNEGEAEQYARNCQPLFAPQPSEPSAGYVRLSGCLSG